MRIMFFLVTAALSVLIPLLSGYIWYIILGKVFPGLRGIVHNIIDRTDEWRRNISLSSLQILFYIVCIIAIPISVVLELMIAAPLVILFGIDNPYILTISVSFAGPIEECMKLAASIIVFIIVARWLEGKEMKTDPVKLGMAVGLFTGACFGFTESIGYLAPAFWEIGEVGLKVELVDAIIWRAVLGVSIHALYTGLASGGLGRSDRRSRLVISARLLGIAIILHTLNNLVQGIFLLILDLDPTTAYIITDIIQITLIAVLMIVASRVWRGKIFHEKNDRNESPPMRRKSKRIYARPLH